MSSDNSSSSSQRRQPLNNRYSYFIDDTVNSENPQQNNLADRNGSRNSFAVYVDRSFMGDHNTTSKTTTHNNDSSINTSCMDTTGSSGNHTSQSIENKDPKIRQDTTEENPIEASSPQSSKASQDTDNTVSTTALNDMTNNVSDTQLHNQSTDTHELKFVSTPIRHDPPVVDGHERTPSSLYQYDETIEPDIEEAVKLLKKEMKVDQAQVNRLRPDANSSMDNYSYLTDDNNPAIKRQSIEFHPQVFHMISKSSSSVSGSNVSGINTHRPQSQIMHSPRSPSLINKFIVNQVLENETMAYTGSPLKKESRIPVTLNESPSSHYTSTTQASSRNINRLSNSSIGLGIPKIPVLRRVSGPSKWAHTTTPTKSNGIIGTSHISTIEPRSPLQRIYQTSIHNDNESMNGSDNLVDLESQPLTTTTITPPPLPPVVSVPVSSINNNHDLNNSVPYQDLPQQRINNSSVESFDSEILEFKDIYSVRRIIVTISLCIICPVIFFMIALGSRAGINDYRIMKMILNDEHRIGLMKGFIWDVKVTWFRNLCLLLGIIEIIIIGACIGIGVGVGIRLEG